jgi:4-amino-4-deoxy-L-arabinose transferase-like glycosyltransferase
MTRRLLLLLLLAAPLFLWRLNQPGFSDTEGMHAEPAREMVLTGDWVTPRMNGEPFLTKPPLMYWLPATVFTLAGPTEYARIWSVLAALTTIFFTGLLGRELFGERAGLFAAAVLATTMGFLVEARLLRADTTLVCGVTMALYCYERIRRGAGKPTVGAFWVILGVGMLDKALVPLVLVGATIALVEIVTGELRPRTLFARLRHLSTAWGLAIIVAVAGPWHLLAGQRNPGFLWDYFVNQHLLFFFDQKLPRDSIPDSLGFFWAIFLARSLPWSLVLPAAILHNLRVLRSTPTGEPKPLLPLLWLVAVLGFFSLAASRLEHYCLPALPAMALVVGATLTNFPTHNAAVLRVILIAPVALAAVASFVVGLYDPAIFLTALDPTLIGLGLETLIRPVFLILTVGWFSVALLLVWKRYWLALGANIATAIILFSCVQLAHERVEPLFSWRPFARTIQEIGPQDSRVFFRASDEYQLCGGLNFYLERRLDLLAPPGWTPPTFLEGRTNRLFTPRAEFEEEWRSRPAFLVSDDVSSPDEEAQLAPGPYLIETHAGERVILRSPSSTGE